MVRRGEGRGEQKKGKQGRSAGNVSVDKKMHSLWQKDIHLTHTHTHTLEPLAYTKYIL